MSYNPKRIPRWYFGGVASSVGALVTHPLDLLKVLIQTQKEKVSVVELVGKVVKEDGILAFYSGISASMLRQYTYTLTRFGIYNVGTTLMDTKSMSSKVFLAGFAGGIAGFVGSPADLINVRLQNDVKLPKEKRRNYKHALDGLVRVTREEGFVSLFNGASITALRGMLMNVGQIAFYEQTKSILILYMGMKEQMSTYLLGSMVSAIAATTLTQPIDVVKTRLMNASVGQYQNVADVFVQTSKEGPIAFFKGYTPALLRLGPHTMILFIVYEYLRLYFGYLRLTD